MNGAARVQKMSKHAGGPVRPSSSHEPLGSPTDCVQFEVWGKVQQVHFRKYTERIATKLSLRGWVMNTSQGTVVGEAFGDREALKELAHWLQHTGSPKSRIHRADIHWNTGSYEPADFTVRRKPATSINVSKHECKG